MISEQSKRLLEFVMYMYVWYTEENNVFNEALLTNWMLLYY